MKSRSDVLLVGQTPPPYHGQAVVTEMLFEYDWNDLVVERLRMAYSERIEQVGFVSIWKILHLFSLILKTWGLVISRRPRILYYLPASANRTPVVRDIIYLACTRWCFSKTVFHYHAGGLPEYLESAGLLGRLAKKIYSAANLSIEICETEHSPGRIFSATRTMYVPNGLDVKNVPRSRSVDDELRILFMGVLNEGKGVLDVIRAVCIAQKRGCQCHVHLTGAWASPDFKTEAEAMVADLGVEELIHFTGPLKGDYKWQAYADADMFLFPSHYASENFPLVIIEAMAFGLPVITTKWRGIPQLVGDSDAAILCDVYAPDDYAEAIALLCNDENKRNSMRNAATAFYERRYTRRTFVTTMENAFKSLLSD